MRLTEKVAVVTGAARGVGAAIAAGLAREGSAVVAVASDESAYITGTDLIVDGGLLAKVY